MQEFIKLIMNFPGFRYNRLRFKAMLNRDNLMIKAKFFGGVLLIAGTCIGGGMLGLPIATAKGGFLGSSLLFVSCWLLMTFTALLTLEVNLYFPKNSNMFSMARETFGRSGEVICWTLYLLFLYALVSAYIAGGQDILHGLLGFIHIDIPIWICGILFVTIFGAIVAAGIKHVDLFNRLLMFLKFATIFSLMFFISAHINIQNYQTGQIQYVLPALTIAITSFGFSIIVPSLRNYFDDEITQLRLAILIGSLLPLICYIAWDGAIFGLIPFQGEFGLEPLLGAAQPVTGLMQSISHFVPTQMISVLSKLFTSICVLTAFACVSLGLSDYLADGLKIDKADRRKNLLVTCMTFVPPLLVVIFYPKAFILFLSLAGLFCVILQALMPAMMAWICRYRLKKEGIYQVAGGKLGLCTALAASSGVIIFASYDLLRPFYH